MAQPFCSKCGNPVRPDQEYCLACGAAIGEEPGELKPILTSDEVSVSSASADVSPQTPHPSNRRYVLYGLAGLVCLGIVVYAVVGASFNPLSLLGLAPSPDTTSTASHTATVSKGNTASASSSPTAQASTGAQQSGQQSGQQPVVVNVVESNPKTTPMPTPTPTPTLDKPTLRPIQVSRVPVGPAKGP